MEGNLVAVEENMVAVTDTTRARTSRVFLSEATGEVHWNAVFAGVVVALATQILLALLGIAVGAATFAPDDAGEAATNGWVAYAWWSISGIAAAFAGGWTAGNVSSAVDDSRYEGAFQGFISWAVSLVLMAVFLVGSVGATGIAARLAGPLALPSPTQHSLAVAALWAFIALLIGAGASLAGGYFGAGLVHRLTSRIAKG
jgi:hypothetical protein